MAVTRLKRKDRRNKARAHNRIRRMKQLTQRPVIRNMEGVVSGAAVEASADSTQEEE
ncbi:MAG: hypothetical protein OER04_06555 [Cyclobacteriaceae bacterium]|nr:hypothetical protein [Cyclobacteriaceae bacterium]